MIGMLQTNDTRYRLAVASRVIAAFGGGYLLTSLLIIAAALLLPYAGMGQAEAALATSLASFPLYAVIILAVFWARTALLAWIGLALASVVPALIYALLQPGGAG